jgi:hypothetical protein
LSCWVFIRQIIPERITIIPLPDCATLDMQTSIAARVVHR